MALLREDGRKPNQLRSIKIEPNFNKYPEGSVFIRIGNTWVLCNCSVEDGVPDWMKTQNKPGGWITAEYNMLPRATYTRKPRELSPGGRTLEIKRLVGRSLRACVDLERLGSNTFTIDCDVIQADGGTRTAAITGGFLALALAIRKVYSGHNLEKIPHMTPVAAISVGVVNTIPLLDLDYREDSTAQVDANIVMNANLDLIEIQGTAEKLPFSRNTWGQLLDLAELGIKQLFEEQNKILKRD